MKEINTPRVSAVFTADTEFHIRLDATDLIAGYLYKQSHAILV
jgi:hypothetical protein